MRVNIYDKNNKHIASFVAKTCKGFNQKQQKQIDRIRKELQENNGLMKTEA